MKKLIAFILVISLSLFSAGCGNEFISTPDLEIEDIEVTEPIKYSVTIDVDCEDNLVFSKYNVAVFVSYSELGVLDHGTRNHFRSNLKKAYTQCALGTPKMTRLKVPHR